MIMDSEAPVQPCGNRCGHDPEAPRWFAPPEEHKPRPGILRKLGEKIRGYYDEPAKTLPSLNLANGKDSQQRSERREGCLGVLGCLIHYLDLLTLRVGIPKEDGSFGGIGMERIAELSGMGLRRVERATHDLVAAGIVIVHPIAKEERPGEFTGLPAIRTISTSLFAAFGLSFWLKHERDKASKRRRKEKCSEEATGRMDLLLAGARAKLAKPSAQGEPSKLVSKASVPRGPSPVADLVADLLRKLRGRGPP
jgi:hypothetical protein